ncbi:MAG TPA: hypothetical protein VFR58_08805 [Flavisolibacter sp.]|nr:hypothetical protein [Flavisolibacter sp.]
MTTTTLQNFSGNYTARRVKSSVFSSFASWCEGQQQNRLLWLGIALAGHGCILTPLTIMAVLLAGTNLALFMLAISAMAMALVTNLAALPTKITIPVFVLSILIDLGIIITTAFMGFSLSNTF